MAMELPALVRFCGDWQTYEDRVYAVYLKTIIQNNLRFNNLPVRPLEGGVPRQHPEHGPDHLRATPAV